MLVRIIVLGIWNLVYTQHPTSVDKINSQPVVEHEALTEITNPFILIWTGTGKTFCYGQNGEMKIETSTQKHGLLVDTFRGILTATLKGKSAAPAAPLN